MFSWVDPYVFFSTAFSTHSTLLYSLYSTLRFKVFPGFSGETSNVNNFHFFEASKYPVVIITWVHYLGPPGPSTSQILGTTSRFSEDCLGREREREREP